MKRTLVLLLALTLLSDSALNAQVRIKNKKYPSLFWEITGNGMKKKSYLFGTMHVSSKIAFHLSDSFYLGIKNADVVALETNPESWQEDLTKYEFGNGYSEMPNGYLTMETLSFHKYEKRIEQALYSNPSTINNLLYRSYSDYTSDFEEDTYLDMYIYQVGKKWGKKVAGVERYDESMRLMMEAYRDAARDRTRKERSYDYEDGLTPDKLQEAYRTGNLDLLDSINKLNSFSDAFDEKFLYKRNEIQAVSIDSILKTGQSLFVGVGAAHLPGNRGVIEMLRNMGYKLRPIVMAERDSRHKEQVEKIRVPVKFQTHSAEDGFYKADIPGKFYRFAETYGIGDQEQYADMANGSYYIVTRVRTNSALWGQTNEDVLRKIDSVLYENVPGKILSKTSITRNGYKGFDIMNRTRRGDVQRYNLFVTPFEIIIFKMSGNGEYVKNGEEAKLFFNSIQLREYKQESWKKYQPSYGGFAVDFPHDPFISTNLWDNKLYAANDKASGLTLTVIKTQVHNYSFAEEDTFDLALMEESFASSEFIDSQLTRKQTTYKGYPALDVSYRHKDGSFSKTRFLIQGPYYYALIAHGKSQHSKMDLFLNSFEITPFRYEKYTEQTDTSLYYTVMAPEPPASKTEKIELPSNYRNTYSDMDDEEEESEDELLDRGAYRNKIVLNDSTGERVYVVFYKLSRYYYADTAKLEKELGSRFDDTDSNWIVRSKKVTEEPGGKKTYEYAVSDTNSSRVIYTKTIFKDGVGFVLLSQSDTLTGMTPFVSKFFETFKPADTLRGVNAYIKKSDVYFTDLFSTDTLVRKKALKNVTAIRLEDSDLPNIKKAISSLSWKDKNYIMHKKAFMEKLSRLDSNESSLYLKDLYYAAGDTIEFQYVALESLLQQQTQFSFNTFRDIITVEPPVLGMNNYSSTPNYYPNMTSVSTDYSEYSFSNGSFMDNLYDTLQLTRTIFPDILPLINLDDYKEPMMNLLQTMVDSSLVQPKDYEIYFSKLLIEAKQALKKQTINEKKKAIEKAQEGDEKMIYDMYERKGDNGNSDLTLYATLLLPFADKNTNVMPLIEQMLQSNDKRLKYNTMDLLLRNKRKVNDTLFTYFAANDEYRLELYRDLRKLKMLDKFPAQYNTHIDLARSELYTSNTYIRPDSIVYIDRVQITQKGKTGFVYFFKYKKKKDDVTWDFATVGMLPTDPKQYFIDDSREIRRNTYSYYPAFYGDEYDFTGLMETSIKEEEPIKTQINKEMKRMLYSKRKSAVVFYLDRGNGDYAMPYFNR